MSEKIPPSSLAYEAMLFAREVHKDQRRKYTGDLRACDPRLIEALIILYQSGLSVTWIAKNTGIGKTAIRNFIAHRNIERIESMFEDGVQCLACEGESFRRIPWANWYFVSDCGRVVGMSLAKPGTEIKAWKGNSGYLCARLTQDSGKVKNFSIHKLVLRVLLMS